MTVPFLSVRPKAIRLKVSPRFPAQVLGRVGIDIDKASGTYNIDLDYSKFPPATALPTPITNQYALGYDIVLKTYTLVPAAVLGGGITDAPSDNQLWARKNANWSVVPPVVPLDPDLVSLAAATGTNTIYYRSAPDTWSPVTVGSGLTFTGGVISSPGGVTPAALTKTDDINVTLTLGGTPASALLQATSITVGWNGALSAARGGLGVDASAQSGVPLFAAGVPTFTATTGTGNFVRANSPALTGAPTSTTPPANDNTTAIATTAWVQTNAPGTPPATVPPLMDGTAAVGVATKYAREDHVHPTDTSRAPLASPTFTGDPKAPTPTAGDNDTSIATTAFVTGAITTAVVPASANPLMNGAVAVGVSTKYAREDHVHPVDTSRAPLNSPSLTGVPLSTTPAFGDNSTKIATTAFVLGQVRDRVIAARTYYFDPAVGSDTTGDGTIGNPYASLFKTLAVVSASDITTQAILIQKLGTAPSIAVAGSLNTVTGPWVGSGAVTIDGNNSVLTTNSTSLPVIIAQSGARVTIRNCILGDATNTPGTLLQATSGGVITVLGGMQFAKSATYQLYASGGTINLFNAYSIIGGGLAHIRADSYGSIIGTSLAVTLTGTPAFSTFLTAVGGKCDYFLNTFNGSSTGTGSASGNSWLASNGGVVNLNGASPATYLPGNGTGSGTNFSAAPWGLVI